MSIPIKEIFVSYWVNHSACTHCSRKTGTGSVYASPHVWRSAGVRLNTQCDLECGGGVGWNNIISDALQLQLCGDRSLFEIALWRCTIDLCKLIANENNKCSLRVSLSLKLWLMLTVWEKRTRERRGGIGPEQPDGLMCHPQPELEDMAPSRWEWTTLWQPSSKWQNPSSCIEQLFLCLSPGIFGHSLLLFIPLSSPSLHHNPAQPLPIDPHQWLVEL